MPFLKPYQLVQVIHKSGKIAGKMIFFVRF